MVSKLATSARVSRGNVNSQSGMGLIELLVYTALLLVFLSAVGGILIALVTVQRNVINANTATGQAQVVSQSLRTGVRNATSIQLTTIGTQDQLVIAKSATPGATASWVCLAWYYAANTKEIWYQRSSAAIPVPVQGQLSGWSLLAQGVTKLANTQVFKLTGTKLGVSFKQQIGNEAAASVVTEVSVSGGPWVSDPCF